MSAAEPTYKGLDWREALAFLFAKAADIRREMTEAGVPEEDVDRLLRGLAHGTELAAALHVPAVDETTAAEAGKALERNARKYQTLAARVWARTQTSN